MIRKGSKENSEAKKEGVGMLGVATLSVALVIADQYSLGGTYVSWGAAITTLLSFGRAVQIFSSLKRN